MDSDLVHEPRGEELLVDVGAHEPDPLVGGDLLGLREGTLDPVGDEREYRVRARRRPEGSSNAQLWSLIPSSPSPCSGLSLGAAM
jgi:hypothetical protein